MGFFPRTVKHVFLIQYLFHVLQGPGSVFRSRIHVQFLEVALLASMVAENLGNANQNFSGVLS